LLAGRYHTPKRSVCLFFLATERGPGSPCNRGTLRYLGHDLQRPECILAERDGTIWTADARGGVVRLCPDGSEEIVTQKGSLHFQSAGTEASRYLEGTLPNGLAFDRDGSFLISNFGTDCLEFMSRDGSSRVLSGASAWAADGTLERPLLMTTADRHYLCPCVLSSSVPRGTSVPT
jgi:hypothetical protein